MLRNREEYFQIYDKTGLDVDGRKEYMEITTKLANDGLFKVVGFMKALPGFKDICSEDKIILCKGMLLKEKK